MRKRIPGILIVNGNLQKLHLISNTRMSEKLKIRAKSKLFLCIYMYIYIVLYMNKIYILYIFWDSQYKKDIEVLEHIQEGQ